MSDIIGKIYMKLGLKREKFDQGMKQSETQTNKLGAAFKKLGGIIAAAFAIRKIADFFKSTLSFYDKQAKAETALLVALKGRKDIQQRLIWQAQQLQKVTIFGDEETIKMQSLLASLGMTEKEIRMLTPLIQDMATALGMDLTAAASLVGKTVTTTTDALARYFKTGLSGVNDQTQRAIVLTNALTKNFKGQAQAAAKAGIGPLTQMANLWGDFKEKIGQALISTGKLKVMLESLKKVLDGLLGTTGTSEGIDAATKLTEAFQNRPKDWQKEFFQKQIEGIKKELDPLQSQYEKIATNWKVFGQTFVWNKHKAKGLSEQINFLNAQLRVYKNLIESLNKGAEQESGLAKQTNMIFAKMMNAPSMRVPGLAGFEPNKATPIQNGLHSSASPALADMSSVYDRNIALSDKARKAFGDEKNGVIDLTQAYSQFGVMAAGAFENIIESLVSGQGNMDDALKAALGMMGDFSVQMGEMMIAQGIVKTLAGKWAAVPGPTLILAGAGLVAAGAIGKAIAHANGPFEGGGAGAGYVPSYASSQMNNPNYNPTTQRIEMYAILRGDQIELTTRKSVARKNRIG